MGEAVILVGAGVCKNPALGVGVTAKTGGGAGFCVGGGKKTVGEAVILVGAGVGSSSVVNSEGSVGSKDGRVVGVSTKLGKTGAVVSTGLEDCGIDESLPLGKRKKSKRATVISPVITTPLPIFQ